MVGGSHDGKRQDRWHLCRPLRGLVGQSSQEIAGCRRAAAWGEGHRPEHTLENAQPRRLTQLASRQAYRLKFDGIFYHSRYGQSLENWAIFEPFPLENAISEALSEDDPDLMEALRIHAIHLA